MTPYGSAILPGLYSVTPGLQALAVYVPDDAMDEDKSSRTRTSVTPILPVVRATEACTRLHHDLLNYYKDNWSTSFVVVVDRHSKCRFVHALGQMLSETSESASIGLLGEVLFSACSALEHESKERQ